MSKAVRICDISFWEHSDLKRFGASISRILLKLLTLHSSHWKEDKGVLETSVDLESSVSVSNYCATTLKRPPNQGDFSTPRNHSSVSFVSKLDDSSGQAAPQISEVSESRWLNQGHSKWRYDDHLEAPKVLDKSHALFSKLSFPPKKHLATGVC